MTQPTNPTPDLPARKVAEVVLSLRSLRMAVRALRSATAITSEGADVFRRRAETRVGPGGDVVDDQEYGAWLDHVSRLNILVDALAAEVAWRDAWLAGDDTAAPAKLADPRDVIAATGYTPPAEPVPAELDRRTPDGAEVTDALTRLDAAIADSPIVGAVGACLRAYRRTDVNLQAGALLEELRVAVDHEATVLDRRYQPDRAKQVRADFETVAAALRSMNDAAVADALTRMATWAPNKATIARRALTQGPGAAQAALVDLDTIMPVDLDNRALADVEIIRAALRRVAGWKSL